MKFSKKATTVAGFCIGALLLVSTGFAEISSKSGYDQLKESIKNTAKICSTEIQSFKVEGDFVFKDGDKLLYSTNNIKKFDIKNGSSENISNDQYANGVKGYSYSFGNKEKNIWYSQNEDTYYESPYSGSRDTRLFTNPFEEERAKDVEKIFDAIVGNLRDYIVAEENGDGSKEFSGSISEAQIPTLINAVASFGIKQGTSDQQNNDMEIPQITDDIYINKVSGKSNVNKEGMIESIIGSVEISGKDKDGNIHNLAVEFLVKISDIDNTVVTDPDLTGKKVEKRIGSDSYESKISSKYIGKYKNDIVINKDDKFVKIGERHLIIAHADDESVAGSYYEEYIPEYQEYAGVDKFTFDIKLDHGTFGEFNSNTSSNSKINGSISFDTMTARTYFSINSNSLNFDSNFVRDFEE